MLRVISCTRTATPEGYSSIQAVVQLDNDGKMDGAVEGYVRLHFTFLREPQHDVVTGDDNGEHNEIFYADADDYFSDDDDHDGEDSTGNEQPSKKRKRASKDTATPASAGATKESDETDDEIIGDDEQNNKATEDSQAISAGDKKFTPKTIITYKIDYSIDYGKKEQLLGVDIYALGEHPSPEEAMPMINDEVDEEEDGAENYSEPMNEDKVGPDNNTSTKEKDKQSPSSAEEFEDIEMSDDDDNNPNNEENSTENGDRFGVYINPENVVAFLDRTNMNFNEQSVFYLLMTLPFYEHEWDISGFLLSALFDEEDDEENEDEEELEEGEDGRGAGCKEDCTGDQPCCVPCA